MAHLVTNGCPFNLHPPKLFMLATFAPGRFSWRYATLWYADGTLQNKSSFGLSGPLAQQRNFDFVRICQQEGASPIRYAEVIASSGGVRRLRGRSATFENGLRKGFASAIVSFCCRAHLPGIAQSGDHMKNCVLYYQQKGWNIPSMKP
jgi:hypothetical protein